MKCLPCDWAQKGRPKGNQWPSKVWVDHQRLFYARPGDMKTSSDHREISDAEELQRWT